MNYYALLPLVAFSANVTLGCYILYMDYKNSVNRLFSFVTFALAIWALGNFFTFMTLTPEVALHWNKLAMLGSSLYPVFLLHFFLVFTKRKFISRKIYLMPLYLPSCFFIFVNFTTNLITESVELSYWGYRSVHGILFFVFTLYMVGYVIAGFYLCYRFYLKEASAEEKIQAKFLMVAITFPLVGGTITEFISPAIGYDVLPLSTALTTIMVVIIACAIVWYKLMTPIYLSIQRKLIAGFLIVALLFSIIGYLSFYVDNILLLISVICISIILGFGNFLLVYNSISRPIIKLRDIALKIGEGNLDTKIGIESPDEIGELASAFRQMTKDLKKSKNDLETLVKQKDEFIGQLGHDLKNPLSVLMNALPIIKEESEKAEIKKDCDVAIRNAEYIKNLVIETLKIAELSSTKTTFDINDTNLLEIVDNVIQDNQLVFDEKNIKIENMIDKNITVLADSLRIKEVFSNLVSNAVKYLPEGGKLTFDMGKSEEKETILIAVKDNGCGMTQKQLSHIFDEFYKADVSRHDLDSIGLGLSICKRIIEKHGGRIWAESHGKGTTFYFTLKMGKINKYLKDS
ncbi:MAG: HAMP domain-containing protein [Thermoplasmatales archaeon]|nr:MAG: HAMP domain-containing protein [Thermoplasmatales archaeon]